MLFTMSMQTKRTKKAGIVGKYGMIFLKMTYPPIYISELF
jgi:hypothetical protein